MDDLPSAGMSAMTSQDSPQPSPSHAARALLRIWPRLIAPYLIVGLSVYYGWPHLSVIVAHAASTLILLFNSIPYIGDFGWADSSITVSDRIFQLLFAVDEPSLRFTFGFPVGFALGLPGVRTVAHWRRVFWTLVTSLGACAVVLAILSDWLFEANFRQFDVGIHAVWHSAFLAHAHDNFETFSMVL